MNYYFNGIIDDIRIYNRSLSEVEIKQLYGNNHENNPPDIPNTPIPLDWTNAFLWIFGAGGIVVIICAPIATLGIACGAYYYLRKNSKRYAIRNEDPQKYSTEKKANKPVNIELQKTTLNNTQEIDNARQAITTIDKQIDPQANLDHDLVEENDSVGELDKISEFNNEPVEYNTKLSHNSKILAQPTKDKTIIENYQANQYLSSYLLKQLKSEGKIQKQAKEIEKLRKENLQLKLQSGEKEIEQVIPSGNLHNQNIETESEYTDETEGETETEGEYTDETETEYTDETEGETETEDEIEKPNETNAVKTNYVGSSSAFFGKKRISNEGDKLENQPGFTQSVPRFVN